MEYLALRKFKSYGVFYNKGSIISEDKIRNVRLKLAEGKIIPATDFAVPSSPNTTAVATDVASRDTAGKEPEAAAAVNEESSTVKKLRLHK
jgi:hypothetical protein